MSYDPEPEIDQYLQRLAGAAHDLPKARRNELLEEIEQHIREALAQAPCANREEMLELLAHVGDPAEVAAAANDDANRGRRWMRRHRLALVASGAALALIALAIGSFVWIQAYQPLALAGFEMLPRGTEQTLTVDGYAASVKYKNGAPFQLGFAVRNEGRFPVRVLGVPYSSDISWLKNLPWSARLMMATETAEPLPPELNRPGESAWKEGRLEPFHPFDLKPGGEQFLLLKGVYANCGVMLSHGTIPVSDFPIRYSFLWKTATVRIPIPGGLTIVPPNDPRVGCIPKRR